MIDKINFYTSLFLVGLILISIVAYSISSKFENGDAERIKGYSNNYPNFIKLAYRFIGGWIIWIAEKIISFIPSEINPSRISLIGMLMSVASALAIVPGYISLGGMFLLISGLMDVLDGKQARKNKKASPSGALVDSVLDRIGEIAIFSSIAVSFILKDLKIPAIITILSLGFSILVSYVRARGESLGIKSEEGIMRRQERIFLLTSALIIDSLLSTKISMYIAIIIILLGSIYTSFERFKHLYEKLNDKETKKNDKTNLFIHSQN